ncbi:MAG: dethiobiotin synthase [Cyclobacteriaceae bacterium]
MMKYFVTAIGTDSGKTLASAILCDALRADYWKPIQAGLPRDTDVVRDLISNKKTIFHPEAYLLKTAASPHAAARIDQTVIRMTDIQIPKTENRLIIEGAGGCLVPLNDKDLVIDLIALFKSEVIVISNHYLGSINHTLLTLEALKKRNVPLKGLIFNGDTNEESERIILHHTKLKCLLRIKKEPEINPDIVQKYASLIKANWNG